MPELARSDRRQSAPETKPDRFLQFNGQLSGQQSGKRFDCQREIAPVGLPLACPHPIPGIEPADTRRRSGPPGTPAHTGLHCRRQHRPQARSNPIFSWCSACPFPVPGRRGFQQQRLAPGRPGDRLSVPRVSHRLHRHRRLEAPATSATCNLSNINH